MAAEEDGAERRQRQVQRERAVAHLHRHRLDGAEVAVAAAAELGGVGVEDLGPLTGLRLARGEAIDLPLAVELALAA